jgi:hypothetical protein
VLEVVMFRALKLLCLDLRNARLCSRPGYGIPLITLQLPIGLPVVA